MSLTSCTQIQFINISDQEVGYNIEYINTPDTTNVINSSIVICEKENRAVYENPTHEKVAIYKTDGVCVYTTYERIDVTLPKGIYLVKIGKLTQKIIIY